MVPPISGRIPPYRQLCQEFHSRIANGRWPRGRLLKSDGLIAEEFGVSVATVRRAFDILERLHIIERVRGHRKIVSLDTARRAAVLTNVVDLNGAPVAGDIEIRSVEALPQSKLRVGRVRFYRGRPFAIECAEIAATTDRPSLEDLAVSASNAVFDGRIAVTKQEYAAVVEPCTQAVELFALKPSASVLEIRRTLFDLDEQPLESSIAHCVLGTDLRYRTAEPNRVL